MDKVVVITGASSGIGAAVAELLGKEQVKTVVAARREAELLAVAARSGAHAVVADMTKREEAERLRDAAIARFGRIDVWINNVGRGISRPVAMLTDEDLDEMMRDNVKTALYGIQAVLPHMQARGDGQIINVSSVLGRVPMASIRSAYSAAKHALNALTAMLRVDLAASHPGIHVTLVSPGVVATDFGHNARHGGPDSRNLPFAQSAEEVAAVIVDAIHDPRPDVYTRPQYHELVVAYYSDVAAAEQRPPFARGK